MNEWDVIIVLCTVIPIIGVFGGVAWKFGSMLTELKGMINNVTVVVEIIKADHEETNKQINQKLNDHEIRIRETEITLSKLK